MNPDLDRINKQLSLIMEHAPPLDPGQAQAFATAAQEIETNYKAALDTLADQTAGAEAKKQAKDVTDSINKNLPNFTKALLSATSAFKSQDYINGSAAIMDMCASMAQMIGSLSSAAGPFGAVFGAVFTILGQILTYFGPKQPSLKDQIVAAMKDLKADERLQDAESYGMAVQEYTKTIYRVKSVLPKHLKLPIKTAANLVNFQTVLSGDISDISNSYKKLSNLYEKWKTAAWLEDEKTQDLEKWPEVLGVFCRTYSDSLTANMALASMGSEPLVKQRLQDVSPSNPNYEKHKDDFIAIKALLIKLKAKSLSFPRLWNDANELMWQVLQKLRPVAQDRGLFVHLGDDRYLYAATGRKAIQSDSWKNLPIGWGRRGHRFSITVPKEDRSSLKPQYHIFFCEHWSGRDGGQMEHGRVKPSPVEISGQGVISSEKFSDVWALPAPTDDKPRDKGASFVYAAHDGGTSGSVQLFELDAKNQLTAGNWWPPTKAGLLNVRAVTHPPATLPDDPDKDGMLPGSALLGGVDHYGSIIYGALRSSSEIYVDQSNTRCYVPAPWTTYSGIDVDPYYLWVFRPEGLACATHASVLSCILGKRQTPRWMEHSPTQILGDQSKQGPGTHWFVNREVTTSNPLKGIISLSPCKDGTLYASVYTRTVFFDETTGCFVSGDDLGSYTAVYSIDLEGGKLNVDPWVKCGGDALQVQKLPIPCWPLFESLDAELCKSFDAVLNQTSDTEEDVNDSETAGD